MSNKKIIGIALIIAGVALCFWGYDIYDSAASHLKRAFDGNAPIKAYALMGGGAAATLLGILKVK